MNQETKTKILLIRHGLEILSWYAAWYFDITQASILLNRPIEFYLARIYVLLMKQTLLSGQ